MKEDFFDSWLFKATVGLLFAILAFYALAKSAPYLKTLAIGLLISMLLLPIAQKLENKLKIGRTASSIACMLTFLASLGLLITLVGFQANRVAANWEDLKKTGKERVKKMEAIITEKTGVTEKQINQFLSEEGLQRVENFAEGFLVGSFNSLGDLFIITIYIFLLLQYRAHFKKFFVRLVDYEDKKNVSNILKNSAIAVQNYLKAKFIIISILATLYATGLTLLGVQYGIFYGVLAALLTIIPYVGNIIGVTFPFFTAILYNDLNTALFVLALFGVSQMIESYLLEPLFVKQQVNLNPFFSISFAILGAILWGIAGMVLAIPYLAVLYILCSHIDSLKHFAFLLSGGDEEQASS